MSSLILLFLVLNAALAVYMGKMPFQKFFSLSIIVDVFAGLLWTIATKG